MRIPHGSQLRVLAALCVALAWAGISRAGQPEPFEQLFGYTAFPAGERDFPRYLEKHWTRVLQAERQSPCLERTTSCLQPADAPQWVKLAAKAPSMEELTLLRTVNAFFNKFPAASDMKIYGVSDYWPSLAEFFRHRSGDCKAYTLAKYFALRALGVPDGKLRIVVARQTRFKANHSMLAVATSKGVFIMDDLVRPPDLIQPQEKLHSEFIPLFMLNETGRWSFRQLDAKYSNP